MRREPDMRAGGFAALLLSPIGLLYCLFLLLPISFFLAVSAFKYSPAQLYVPALTGENYARLLGDAYYRGIIFETFRIAAIVTAVAFLLGYPLALFLSRMRSAWRGVLMFLVVAPLMTGVIVRTYGWIVLLGDEGAVNAALQSLGLIARPLKLIGSELAVIVALVHIMLPYLVFPVFSSLVGQDRNLVQAASTLGARPLRAFLEVTLPLSRPGIAMGAALVFTLTAGAIVTPALLGGRNVLMIGQVVYQLVLSTFNWPLGAAVATILVVCQLSVVSLYFRRMRRGG